MPTLARSESALTFDLATLAAGFVVSGTGFVLLRYGKHRMRVPHMLVGVAMMLAPLFTGGPLLTLAIGGGLAAALWLGVRMGL